jgi:hypothetical protein
LTTSYYAELKYYQLISKSALRYVVEQGIGDKHNMAWSLVPVSLQNIPSRYLGANATTIH